MRWIPYLILLYAVLLVQVSLMGLVKFSTDFMGTVWPDLLAVLAFYVVISAGRSLDAMMGAWVAGITADLLSGGNLAIGPMAIMYSLAGFMIFRVRDTFFADKFAARIVLCLIFCLVSHIGWVFMQTLLFTFGWSDLGMRLLQAVGISLYTAAVAPFICVGFDQIKKAIVVSVKRRRY